MISLLSLLSPPDVSSPPPSSPPSLPLSLFQAKEITATVGQAFELAYKKFLETKKAQEDFKRLKEMLKTASPEEKGDIEKKLIEVNKIRAAEYERQKKIAAIQAKMPDPYVKPVTKIYVKGTKGS